MELHKDFSYTSCLDGKELVPSLTKKYGLRTNIIYTSGFPPTWQSTIRCNTNKRPIYGNTAIIRFWKPKSDPKMGRELLSMSQTQKLFFTKNSLKQLCLLPTFFIQVQFGLLCEVKHFHWSAWSSRTWFSRLFMRYKVCVCVCKSMYVCVHVCV